jgi:hypothetical protein
MSLLSLLNQPDVRARFRHEFSAPRLKVRPELRVPPLVDDAGHIGTAFDYLLRFHLERLNPYAVTRRWVAEAAIEELPARSPVQKIARRVVTAAKKNLLRYVQTGNLDDALVESALSLARVALCIRAGLTQYIGDPIDPDAVAELKQLLALIDPAVFTARQVCVLNPTFGLASHMVGGADADLILDHTLIEVKVTKDASLKRQYVNQIIGYYMLYDIERESPLYEWVEKALPITHVAIYFARHAYLHLMPIDETLSLETYPALRRWFQDRAGEESDC